MKPSQIFSFLHQRICVYIRLTRLDKPIGTLLLLWPTLWALWLAAEGKPAAKTVLLFVLGTLLMRSAGCVANDWADRHFDGHVERTQHRPFATGEAGAAEAKWLTGTLCLLAVCCLIPLNWQTWLMSIPALFLALSYPFAKRFFPIPQLYLGLAFSFGIPMAYTATIGYVTPVGWWLFAANICWTLAFDTAYAMADKEDDLKIGIKTSAITFGRYDAEITMLCHGLLDLLMIQVGISIAAGWAYWLALATVVYWQWQQYQKIQGRNRQACFQAFLDNNKIGWLWFTAILAHFSLR